MSEKHIPRPEHHDIKENSIDETHSERVHKHQKELAEKARHEKSQEITSQENTKTDSASLAGMHNSLKTKAYKRVLTKTQHKLNKPARAFSKFTHNPAIDKISNVSAQTIARPSGFLGGSIFAFLGSSIVYYYSKHYGFKYNYLLVFMFFVGGYAVGALLELFIWLVYTRKQRY